MAPSATELPETSALQKTLQPSEVSVDGHHPAHPQNFALNVLHNLQYQHDWTALKIHTHSSVSSQPFPRPLISGVPPTRSYIHPDEQIALLKAEHETSTKIDISPEREWVLPTRIKESFTLRQFSEIFNAIETVPPYEEDAEVGMEYDEDDEVGHEWRGYKRQKRLLLATVHDDSTVVYYIMHDGIVKPRQN